MLTAGCGLLLLANGLSLFDVGGSRSTWLPTSSASSIGLGKNSRVPTAYAESSKLIHANSGRNLCCIKNCFFYVAEGLQTRQIDFGQFGYEGEQCENGRSLQARSLQLFEALPGGVSMICKAPTRSELWATNSSRSHIIVFDLRGDPVIIGEQGDPLLQYPFTLMKVVDPSHEPILWTPDFCSVILPLSKKGYCVTVSSILGSYFNAFQQERVELVDSKGVIVHQISLHHSRCPTPTRFEQIGVEQVEDSYMKLVYNGCCYAKPWLGSDRSLIFLVTKSGLLHVVVQAKKRLSLVRSSQESSALTNICLAADSLLFFNSLTLYRLAFAL